MTTSLLGDRRFDGGFARKFGRRRGLIGGAGWIETMMNWATLSSVFSEIVSPTS